MTEIESKNRRLGYARVSTYGQTLDAQLAQLRKEGCAKSLLVSRRISARRNLLKRHGLDQADLALRMSQVPHDCL